MDLFLATKESSTLINQLIRPLGLNTFFLINISKIIIVIERKMNSNALTKMLIYIILGKNIITMNVYIDTRME